jgi:Family of unknown function (DUF5681)
MAKFTSEGNPGLRFPAGRSGNPVGRPKTLEKLRREVASELVRHGSTLTRAAVQRALAGDVGCLAACMHLLGSVTAEQKLKAPEEPAAKG